MTLRRPASAHALFASLAITASVLAACSGGGGGEAGPIGGTADRLFVATTVAPVTSIVSEVVGALAIVEGVVPEGTDSHTFEPPPSAARTLSRADLVFLNGLGLEEPTQRLAEANLRADAEVVALGDLTVDPGEYIFDFSFPREAGRPNPHLWTNPPMVRRFAEIVAETMGERDPDHALDYEANLRRFVERVDALDRAMVEATSTVPSGQRKLLTYHDAYAYFARQYGWTVLGAIQPSSFAEPTPRDVVALISQVRDEGVPAIFGSEVFPSPVLEQIGKEAGIRYVDTLRDDDLPGEPGDPEHSWLGLMRFNFVTMVEALGGDASALEAVDISDVNPGEARYPQ